MRRFIRRLTSLSNLLGINPNRLATTFRGLPAFWTDYRNLRKQLATSGKEFPFGRFYPVLEDRFAESGTVGGHYFHQDLLVAQWLYADKPVRHVDVGSRLDGFVAHAAAFREIEVFDIRPLTNSVSQIKFTQCDFTTQKFEWGDYCDSVSCLHALEHFGLGRYGDTVDYYGYQRGWDNLYRILKPGGRLYFSLPIGPQRIEFNAHRVFSVPFLLSLFENRFKIERFAYVNDAGDLIKDADWQSPSGSRNFDCRYGCGIFSLLKQPVTDT